MTFQPGENLLRQERIHPAIFLMPVLTAVSLLVLALPVWFTLRMLGTILPGFSIGWLWIVALWPLLLVLVPSFLVTLFAYLKSEITLTNKRLLYRTGVVARASGETPLENVESIFILEPLLGRLFGYGTVTVTTLGGANFPISYIGKPQVFHAVLQNAVASAKLPRRQPPKPAPPPGDDSRYMPKF